MLILIINEGELPFLNLSDLKGDSSDLDNVKRIKKSNDLLSMVGQLMALDKTKK